MTDIYESHEREAGHDEVLTPEQGEVHEAPSDYEFADEHSATAEHSEEQDAASASTDTKGRSPLLPIGAAVIGIVLLGGVAWWQFGGSSAPTPPSINTAAMAPLPSLAPPVVDTTPPAPPQPVTPTVDNTPLPVAAPTPVVADAPVIPVAAAVPMPAAVPAAVIPTASVAPVALAALPVPVPTPTPVPMPDARIDALAAHIDDLQKSLDQITQQLGQVSALAAPTGNAGAPSTKDLQDHIDALEQQIAQLRHAAPTLTSPASVPVTSDAEALSAPPAKPVKTVTHHVKTITPVTHKAIVAKKTAAPATVWVLRAAVPGQAWVSTSATSTDLKQVHVGDTLDGVGKIFSIRQENGNWVVAGRKGVIQ